MILLPTRTTPGPMPRLACFASRIGGHISHRAIGLGRKALIIRTTMTVAHTFLLRFHEDGKQKCVQVIYAVTDSQSIQYSLINIRNGGANKEFRWCSGGSSGTLTHRRTEVLPLMIDGGWPMVYSERDCPNTPPSMRCQQERQSGSVGHDQEYVRPVRVHRIRPLT